MSVNERLRPLTANISPAFKGQGVRRHGLFFAVTRCGSGEAASILGANVDRLPTLRAAEGGA